MDLKFKMDGICCGIRVVLVVTVAFGLSGVTGEVDTQDPDLKITYTNEFKFELRNVLYIKDVEPIANQYGFVYKGQIVGQFFLFIRDDVPRFSDEPYDVDRLKDVKESLFQYVLSIEQDYERQWGNLMLNATFLDTSGNRHTSILLNDPFQADVMAQSSDGVHPSKITCQKKPVNIAFIDEGFELTHPNLIQSVNGHLSRSFFGNEKDVLPPYYSEDMKHSLPTVYYNELSHGTRCMGRVGARPGGGCDSGVAPNLKLVGLKALTFNGGVSDTRQARAMSYKHEDIAVFSCSYGVKDNLGFFPMGPATKTAIKLGATRSRDCRGVIYLFPSGNGHHDNCNADGYANSVDTITIANVDKEGGLPYNIEICPAAIAAAVGEGFNTTDLNSQCSGDFRGSSAATANAAGYAGELLYINPCLSKRDIEHIMVTTAVHSDGISWRTNGAGLKFNDQIGFGQLDLTRMLAAARTWKPVPERHVCEISDTHNKQHITGSNWILKSVIPSNGCRDSEDYVRYVEHVEVSLSLACSNISRVAVQLVSPAGTTSNILTHIRLPAARVERYTDLRWTFMSVNFWREMAEGPWEVKVIVHDADTNVECEFGVEKLVLYGTATHPDQGGGPLSCHKINTQHEETSSQTGVIVGVVLGIIGLCAIIVLIVSYWKNWLPCFKNSNSNYKSVEKKEMSNTQY